jgi:molybdopterin-guanine dinucleotide biosynthesis protein A
MTPTLSKTDITAVILAGGRGSRMGGVDKGLQHFNGVPMVCCALQRLMLQVGHVMINANRNLAAYESFGVPVWPDSTRPGDFARPYAGPLAGFTAGLTRCETPYLLTVPCDTPLFPLDLAARLADALVGQSADFAVASAIDEDGKTRAQPVFCLMARSMLPSLQRYTESGGCKVAAWLAQHSVAEVAFNLPCDDAKAFSNANTLAELQQLQSCQ